MRGALLALLCAVASADSAVVPLVSPRLGDNSTQTIDGHPLPVWFSVVFNGILIGVGGMEVAAGYKLFKPTLMLMGGIAAGVPVFLLTWDNITDANAFWFGCGTGGMAALIAAVASFFLWRVGVFLIGAALGVTIALVLNVTLLYKFVPSNPQLPLEVGGVLLGLGLGMLALRFMRPTVIVATSFIGAYAVIRGIGHFAGGYPSNEFDIGEEVASGQLVFSWTIYVYFAAWVVLAFVGVAVQLLVTSKAAANGEKDAQEKEYDAADPTLDIIMGACRAYMPLPRPPAPTHASPSSPPAGKRKKGKKGKKGSKKGKKEKKEKKGSAKAGRGDALLRDYEAGGEYYEEAGGEGEAAWEDGGEYGYEEEAPPPKAKGFFGALRPASGKKAAAAVDW
jgi:hypothetical protein